MTLNHPYLKVDKVSHFSAVRIDKQNLDGLRPDVYFLNRRSVDHNLHRVNIEAGIALAESPLDDHIDSVVLVRILDVWQLANVVACYLTLRANIQVLTR